MVVKLNLIDLCRINCFFGRTASIHELFLSHKHFWAITIVTCVTVTVVPVVTVVTVVNVTVFLIVSVVCNPKKFWPITENNHVFKHTGKGFYKTLRQNAK